MNLDHHDRHDHLDHHDHRQTSEIPPRMSEILRLASPGIPVQWHGLVEAHGTLFQRRGRGERREREREKNQNTSYDGENIKITMTDVIMEPRKKTNKTMRKKNPILRTY